ncbi:MAG: DNA helicase, partial [Elioraea sp.]|nr:DNA helicase [Elioraea sp.]
EGHAVGRMEGFVFHPETEADAVGRQAVLRAARRALAQEVPRRVAALEADDDGAFGLTDRGGITWRGAEVARLRPGPSALKPLIEVPGAEFLDGAGRERVRKRLARWLGRLVADAFAPLAAVAAAAERRPSLRGLAHALEEGLGIAWEARLAAEEKDVLQALGVRAGHRAIWLPSLLRPEVIRLRGILWAVANGTAPPPPPPAGSVALRPAPGWPEGWARALGFLPAGPVAVRLDVAEKVGAMLAALTRDGPAPAPAGLASRLGCRAADLPAVLRAIGFALRPGAEGAVLVRARRRTPRPAASSDAVAPAGPFAALAALRVRA